MKEGQFRIVLLTCATLAQARKIARSLIQQRLAACANIVQTPVESVYRWKEAVKSAREYLVIVKTLSTALPKLEREVKKLHSYDVPEIVALPIVAGSREYLSWLTANVETRRRV